MLTNDGENLWTKYEPEQNQQKNIFKLNLHPSVCQLEIVLQPSAIFQSPCFQNGITLTANPQTLLI